MADRPPVAVLGAGLAGLSAADTLASRGVPVVVLERDDHVGGLASTVVRDGFHFDYGPHRFHTRSPEILQRVRNILPDELMSLERVSRIRLLDRYFRYPLALGDVLRQMPKTRGAAMVASYVAEKVRGIFGGSGDDNFEDWVVRRFGRSLYDVYFGPYTEKLWGVSPRSLSADWASQRITVPSLSGLLKETLFPSDGKVRSLVSTFHYPAGGIGRIAAAFAERIRKAGGRIELDSPVTEVLRGDDRTWTVTAGGRDYRAASVISTIPVDDYVRALRGQVPPEVRRAAGELTFRAIVFVTLKVDDAEPPAPDHWIYASEPAYRFNRLSIPENFDPDVADGGWQAVFEFTCDRGDGTWDSQQQLIEESVMGGERLGLLDPGRVSGALVTRQSHAYPVYLKDYQHHSSTVLDFLQDMKGSVTCGRQGLFRYNNMDHSIEMGRYAALETLGEGSVREQFSWTRDTWADG
jgi:protoporphyrinogen oxidase